MSQNPSFLTSRSSGRRSGLAVARWYLPPFAGGCRGSGHPSVVPKIARARVARGMLG